MAKKEKKIKPAFSDNLETLINDQGITKKQLAEMIPTSVQTISKACNGIRLTRSMAERIIELFPEYNLAWLMGISELKLKTDVDAAMHKAARAVGEAYVDMETKFYSSICYLSTYAGYKATYANGVLTVNKDHVDYYGGVYTLIRDYETVTVDDLSELKEDIVAFMKYRMKKVIEKGR